MGAGIDIGVVLLVAVVVCFVFLRPRAVFDQDIQALAFESNFTHQHRDGAELDGGGKYLSPGCRSIAWSNLVGLKQLSRVEKLLPGVFIKAQFGKCLVGRMEISKRS